MEIKTSDRQTAVQHLYLPYYLYSTRPLDKSDFNKIIFLEDSQTIHPRYYFTDSIHTQINIEHPWKNRGKYSIFIPPATFTDIYGKWNDTVKIEFTSHSEMDYGSVKIKFQKEIDTPYIIQLIDVTEGTVYKEFKATESITFDFMNLDPRLYKIKLIRDSNNNGKWDTGDYLKHIQPEVVEFYPEDITVRANWDVEVAIKVPLKSVKKQ